MTVKKVQLRLLFADGTEEVLLRKMAHLYRGDRMARQVHGPDGEPDQNLKWTALAWAVHTGGRGTVAEFEDWADNFVDFTVEGAEPEGDDADPPDQAPGTSPT